MTDIVDDVKVRMKRSLDQEFGRMETDFDDTRAIRKRLTDKLVKAAECVQLINAVDATDSGAPWEDTDVRLKVVKTALDALKDIDKAAETVVNVKLKRQEQDIASSQQAKDRIAIILAQTSAGRIQDDFPSDKLERQLDTMFAEQLQEFETKTNPKDLAD